MRLHNQQESTKYKSIDIKIVLMITIVKQCTNFMNRMSNELKTGELKTSKVLTVAIPHKVPTVHYIK